MTSSEFERVKNEWLQEEDEKKSSAEKKSKKDSHIFVNIENNVDNSKHDNSQNAGIKIKISIFLFISFLAIFLYFQLYHKSGESASENRKIPDAAKPQENQNNVFQTFDIPETQAEWVIRVSSTVHNEGFYVIGLCSAFDDQKRHPFIVRFDGSAKYVAHCILEELVPTERGKPEYPINPISSAVSYDGANLYASYVNTDNKLVIEKLALSEKLFKRHWKITQETAGALLYNGSCSDDGRDGLWIVGSKGMDESERAFILHCNADGVVLSDKSWEPAKPNVYQNETEGKIPCSATAVCPDGAGGCYATGFIGNTPSDVFLLHILPDGTVNWQIRYGNDYDYDIKPVALLVHESCIYVAVGEMNALFEYRPHLLKYRLAEGKPQLIRDIVLRDFAIARPKNVKDDRTFRTHQGFMAMTPIGSNIVVGLCDCAYESSGWDEWAIAVIDSQDVQICARTGFDARHHEAVLGLYYNPRQKELLSVMRYAKIFEDHPVMGLMKFTLKDLNIETK